MIDDYCEECGHYNEVPFMSRDQFLSTTECECDCHDED